MDNAEEFADTLPVGRAPEVLDPAVYAELRNLAAKHMNGHRRHRTLQTTMLAHEAWLRLMKLGRKWRDRQHFFATASLAMRHILVDYARRKARLRHGGSHRLLNFSSFHTIAAKDQTDLIILIDEGISALEHIHPERAQVVVDRFFGGMTNQEIADYLGRTERTVERHWALAKAWLQQWMEDSAAAKGQIVA